MVNDRQIRKPCEHKKWSFEFVQMQCLQCRKCRNQIADYRAQVSKSKEQLKFTRNNLGNHRQRLTCAQVKKRKEKNCVGQIRNSPWPHHLWKHGWNGKFFTLFASSMCKRWALGQQKGCLISISTVLKHTFYSHKI